jgi:hypothetical protein
MPRRVLYPGQSFVDPGSLGDLETVKVEDFWQPLSEPVRRLPSVVFAAALISASGVAAHDPVTIGDPGPVPPVQVEQWWQPLSEPVRRLEGDRYAAALIASGTAAHDPQTVGDPETVKVEDFWQPFSEPVRRTQGDLYSAPLRASGTVPIDPATLGDPETVKVEDWWQPLSEPVRPIPPSHYHATVFDDPETIGGAAPPDVSFEWWRPFSEPVWVASWGAAIEASGAAPIDPQTLGDPETVKVEQWWQPLSEPVRPVPNVAGYAFVFDDPESLGGIAPPDVSFEWWGPFAEPIWQPAGDAFAAALAAGVAVHDPETFGDPELTERIEWYAPFSEPVRRIVRALQEAYYVDPDYVPGLPDSPATIAITDAAAVSLVVTDVAATTLTVTDNGQTVLTITNPNG